MTDKTRDLDRTARGGGSEPRRRLLVLMRPDPNRVHDPAYRAWFAHAFVAATKRRLAEEWWSEAEVRAGGEGEDV